MSLLWGFWWLLTLSVHRLLAALYSVVQYSLIQKNCSLIGSHGIIRKSLM